MTFMKIKNGLPCQKSFKNPENFCKLRKIFCHVTLVPVVSTLSKYSTEKKISPCYYLREYFY